MNFFFDQDTLNHYIMNNYYEMAFIYDLYKKVLSFDNLYPVIGMFDPYAKPKSLFFYRSSYFFVNKLGVDISNNFLTYEGGYALHRGPILKLNLGWYLREPIVLFKNHDAVLDRLFFNFYSNEYQKLSVIGSNFFDASRDRNFFYDFYFFGVFYDFLDRVLCLSNPVNDIKIEGLTDGFFVKTFFTSKFELQSNSWFVFLLHFFFFIAFLIFLIGLLGLVMNNWNFIVLLLSLELAYMGCILAVVLFTMFSLGFTLFYVLVIFSIVAADTVLGLSLMVVSFELAKKAFLTNTYKF